MQDLEITGFIIMKVMRTIFKFGNWDAGQHDLNYQIKIYHGFH